jgi:hypothetical protein
MNSDRDLSCPDRKVWDEPMEGALVRAVRVALTRQRVRRIWCGELDA